MSDLVTFLRARLDEDYEAMLATIAREDLEKPAVRTAPRMLREVEAKRAILAIAAKAREWANGTAGATAGYAAVVASDTLHHLADVYSDHPDYDEARKP